MKNGPEQLSARELITVLFGHGTKKESVFACAKRIIEDYGWSFPHRHDPSFLKSKYTLTHNQAARLSACIELGFRWFNKLGSMITLNNPERVHAHVREMQHWQKEGFRGLYLNSRYQLIWDELITIGSLTTSSVHPREVFQPALKVGAAAIILVHNHPSGNPEPGRDDRETTDCLISAATIMHIPIVDHVIIGKEGCFSFKDHGLMQADTNNNA